MADTFLTQYFTLKLTPANALPTTLLLFGMMEFHPKALLTFLGGRKFQIKPDIPDLPGLLSLEMEADSISATFYTRVYSLRFSVEDWYQPINNLVNLYSSSITIKKSPGSTDVHCLYGEEDNQRIELGKAELVERIPVENLHGRSYPQQVLSYVKVNMEEDKFRQFIANFSSKHDHAVSAVELEITSNTISWITQGRSFEYPLKGEQDGSVLVDYRFPVRWDRNLFEMLRSAAYESVGVELTVFDDNLYNKKLYRFLFLSRSKKYFISYVEKVPEETPQP